MTVTYSCLPAVTYTHANYVATPLRSQDIYPIMEWRNAQIEVLRQKTLLTRETQQQYYEDVIKPSFSSDKPSLILFSILQETKLIGYGGFVHIDWQSRRAEVSFLTSPERARKTAQYEADFTAFIHILKNIAFNDLNLQRLSTETFDIRPHVVELLKENGFAIEGRMRNHNYINGKFVDSVIQGCLNRNRNEDIKEPYTQSIKPQSYNTLITSISRKVPLLKAIRQAGERVSKSFRLFGCDFDNNCVGKHFVDTFWHCPVDGELTFDDIVNYCSSNGIHIILPTRDGELQFFADYRADFLKNGIHVMISPPEAVQVCLDKLLFYDFFKNVSTVPVILTDSKISSAMGQRIIVKERFGSGSTKTCADVSPDDAIEYSKQLSSPIFQPYIQGKEYSIDLYLSKKSKTIGTVIRSRDIVINGESQISTTTTNSKLEDICRAAAEHLHLQGHTVFQAIIDRDERIYLIECNCRIGGASTLSFKAGLDSVYYFFLECSFPGLHHTLPPSIQPDLKLIRVPYDHFFLNKEF